MLLCLQKKKLKVIFIFEVDNRQNIPSFIDIPLDQVSSET